MAASKSASRKSAARKVSKSRKAGAAAKKAAKTRKQRAPGKKAAVAPKRRAAAKKAPAIRKTKVALATIAKTPAVAEIDNRIAIIRDNLRQLVEQAASNSGAGNEELMSQRIADYETKLALLTKQREEQG